MLEPIKSILQLRKPRSGDIKLKIPGQPSSKCRSTESNLGESHSETHDLSLRTIIDGDRKAKSAEENKATIIIAYTDK